MATPTKEELQERAQLVRVFEASCDIQYPNPQESNFRLALMKKLGQIYGLREVRRLEIVGPASAEAAPARQAPSAGGAVAEAGRTAPETSCGTRPAGAAGKPPPNAGGYAGRGQTQK